MIFFEIRDSAYVASSRARACRQGYRRQWGISQGHGLPDTQEVLSCFRRSLLLTESKKTEVDLQVVGRNEKGEVNYYLSLLGFLMCDRLNS